MDETGAYYTEGSKSDRKSPIQYKFSSVESLSHVRLFATPWTVACQAPLSMGFSRQEYWCGLPLPSPGDLPHPGIEPASHVSPAGVKTGSLPQSRLGSPNCTKLLLIWGGNPRGGGRSSTSKHIICQLVKCHGEK